MRASETRTLWLSVGSALFAVFLLYSYTQEQKAALTKRYSALERVVIASQDIKAMQTIDESMLDIAERPTDFVQPNALKVPEDAVGLVALAPITKGEQVLQTKIIEPSPVTGLSLQVAPTKRAVTIPVDEVRGVAKLIKPGDRIDLLAALDIGSGQSQKREIKTLMQDVVVLATGLKIMNELPRLYEKIGREEFIKNIRSDTSFSSITIEASPKEAQDLIYILSTSPGSLYLTLRHPSDHTKQNLPTSDLASVLDRVRQNVLREQVRKPTSDPKAAAKPKTRKRSGPFREL